MQLSLVPTLLTGCAGGNMNKRMKYLKASALIIAQQNSFAESLLQKGYHRIVIEWQDVFITTGYRPKPKSDIE